MCYKDLFSVIQGRYFEGCKVSPIGDKCDLFTDISLKPVECKMREGVICVSHPPTFEFGRYNIEGKLHEENDIESSKYCPSEETPSHYYTFTREVFEHSESKLLIMPPFPPKEHSQILKPNVYVWDSHGVFCTKSPPKGYWVAPALIAANFGMLLFLTSRKTCILNVFKLR